MQNGVYIHYLVCNIVQRTQIVLFSIIKYYGEKNITRAKPRKPFFIIA